MPPSDTKSNSASTDYSGLVLHYDGHLGAPQGHAIAIETPVNVVFGAIPFAVMMASPSDLEDFAYGFSFTEGIIDRASDIRSVEIFCAENGIKLNVSLKAENMQRHLGRARVIAGRTGCGVCGIADLEQMPPGQQAGAGTKLEGRVIARALEDAQALQTLNQQTRAVHGAAFCRADGSIVAMREDAGRHNALDKLIGAMLRADVDPAYGFVLITSRASYEMVEKTARFGASILVAISAPTSMAIERAKAYGMTLIAIAREDGAIVFSGPERINKARENER